MHGEGRGGCSFAVEIAGGSEVVEGGFEGGFVVSAVGVLVCWEEGWGEGLGRGKGLTLHSVVGLRGLESSSRYRKVGPIARLPGQCGAHRL